MPKKTALSKAGKGSKKIAVAENGEYDDDYIDTDPLTDSEEERFVNSEDEYDDSEEEQNDSSEDDQAGGESDNDFIDSDNENIDLDTDDENDQDLEDEFNPTEDENLSQADEDAGEDSAEEDDEDAAEEEVDEEGDVDMEVGEDGEEGFVAESRDCHAKNIKKDKDKIVLDDDDSTLYAKLEYQRIPDNERVSDKYITYYEFVRILGIRSQQFNLGAKPLVSGVDHLPSPKMAYVELMAKMTPFIIRRHLPNKKYEEWKIHEMEIIHEIDEEFFVPENFDYEKFTESNKDIISQMSAKTNLTEAARQTSITTPENKPVKKSVSKTQKKTTKSKSKAK